MRAHIVAQILSSAYAEAPVAAAAVAVGGGEA